MWRAKKMAECRPRRSRSFLAVEKRERVPLPVPSLHLAPFSFAVCVCKMRKRVVMMQTGSLPLSIVIVLLLHRFLASDFSFFAVYFFFAPLPVFLLNSLPHHPFPSPFSCIACMDGMDGIHNLSRCYTTFTSHNINFPLSLPFISSSTVKFTNL